MPIKQKDIAEFNATAAKLAKLMERIRKYQPKAEIFMEAEAGLMLFDGPCRGDDEDHMNMNWELQRGRSHWTPGFGCGAI